MSVRKGLLLWSGIVLLTNLSCGPGPGGQDDDGTVVRDGRDLKDDPKVLSPPILSEPIYECTKSVIVQGFVPNSKISVLADGNPVGTGSSPFANGFTIVVSITFTKGQVITATEDVGGNVSGPSNAVTVRSYKDDYPNGIPKPRIDPPPLYHCGRAVGAREVLNGADLEFDSEASLGGGGFGPPVVLATAPNSGAAQYAITNAPLDLGARVRAKYRICAEDSPLSDPEIVQEQPATIPAPTIDQGYEGQEIVVIRNTLNGATLDVYANDLAHRIGGQPTPGGAGQRVRVNPPLVNGDTPVATQALCDKSPPGSGPPVKPCSELPAAKIKPPSPGDTQVEVTESVPGSEIQIYANNEKVGDGGGSVINLVRRLNDGETVIVLQILGKCKSQSVFKIPVKCRASDDLMACSADWPAFRHDSTRNAHQPKNSALADPSRVRTLKISRQFSMPELGTFRASPVVYKGRVYIGNSNGRIYALDANTMKLLWKYPPDNKAALTSQFTCNPSSEGLAASAVIARTRENLDVVIFGAPDRSLQPGLGSGRLFALRADNGAEVWKSPALAVLNGLTKGSTGQLHEQIGYSSPLVRNGRVYVGIANHCDNPIQNGKVMAVDVNSGALVGGFSYQSTNTRGGGIWSSVAAGPTGELYITTGNVASGNPGGEPSTNNGLSMLRLNPTTGSVVWKFQPVPFALDGDPDWASGPTALKASCGIVSLSTQKDGWAYAVNAGSGAPGAPSVRWQFPPTGFPFSPGDGTAHGDTRYLVPGAAWENVFITMTSGVNVVTNLSDGFGRLHGLDACASDQGRMRWLFDVPNVTIGLDYQLGPPTITRGIYFVATASGRVVAFADPTVAPSAGLRCGNPRVSNSDCAAQGFQLVPQPWLLANVLLDSRQTLTEPALAGGSVYVATGGGTVFKLEP